MGNHIIIARYNEDITWVNNLKLPYTIYNKGPNDIASPSIKLPNIGREADTFMYHIITNYESLSDTLTFLQGNPFDHCTDLFNILEKNYDTNTIVPVGGGLISNTLNNLPGQEHRDSLKLVVEATDTYSYYENLITPQYSFVWGAQYIVPKKFIVNKNLEFWKKLYYANQRAYVGPCVLERMWPYIFNYKT
jgi:hypothetical protein